MNIQEVFKQLCVNRYFELGVAKAHKSGHINIPIYLSVGQDHIPAVVKQYCRGWPLFPQHRCHSWCLSWGMSPESIAKELLGRADGCNKGMGGSASLASKEHNVFGHSGLLGDQVPIAVGYAQATQTPTICVLGDAAAEEDYTLASFGYAATHKVPILFVCEDNNLSILTEKKVRRSWEIDEVASSFGVASYYIRDSIAELQIFKDIAYGKITLPRLIEIRTHRHMWHAGSGQDNPPRYDILATMRKRKRLSQYLDYEQNIKTYMETLWRNLLRQQ